MTNTAKTWTAIVIIIILAVAGIWAAYANNDMTLQSYDKNQAGYEESNSSVYLDSTVISSSTSADDDMLKIDAQISGLGSDNSAADQGLQE